MKSRATLLEALTCAIALLILFMFATPAEGNGDMPRPEASAQQELPDNTLVPQENRLPAIGCDPVQGVCLVRGEDIRVYVSRFDAAMRELKALRESKGCAKLEVAPRKPDPKAILRSMPPPTGGRT